MRKITTLLSLVLLCICTSVSAQNKLVRTGWTWSVSNETATSLEGGSNGPAAAMYDGDASTYWHSNWAGNPGPGNVMPQFVKIDLAETKEIGGFEYIPRPNRQVTALKNYRIYITDTENRNSCELQWR